MLLSSIFPAPPWLAAIATLASVTGWQAWHIHSLRAELAEARQATYQERAQQALEVSRQLERSMERRAAADQALASVQSAVTAALRRPHEPAQPIDCPKSGNALDAVIPGLGDRLRAIDAAAAGGGTASGVEVLSGAGASDSGR